MGFVRYTAFHRKNVFTKSNFFLFTLVKQLVLIISFTTNVILCKATVHILFHMASNRIECSQKESNCGSKCLFRQSGMVSHLYNIYEVLRQVIMAHRMHQTTVACIVQIIFYKI